MVIRKKVKENGSQQTRKKKKKPTTMSVSTIPLSTDRIKGEYIPQIVAGNTRHPATLLPPDYAELLLDIKTRIRQAQIRATVAVTRELIHLYWDIGREIVQRQDREGWGKAVVHCLADDLQREFPGMGGFSSQNIWYMRAFYLAWTKETVKLQQPVGVLDGKDIPQVVAQIPWGHNLQLIAKLKDPRQRLWYAQKVIQHGWSRAVLVHQIELDLYGREGKAINNFSETLPPVQSDLAQQILKDPYVFDFLTLTDDSRERELHDGLLEHLRDFMLELGVGFSFVGSQYHLEVGDKDYYIDLLFYHLKLRAFVAIDLKVKEFKPEYTGKMNFYLSAIDDRLRHADDRPSIGIILCKVRNKITVEYALRDTHKPIGVSEYQLTKALPDELKSSLPTVEQLEAELENLKLEMPTNPG
jgi:predicted nuclease of restriction endonuclease-like (RecB) superfamily